MDHEQLSIKVATLGDRVGRVETDVSALRSDLNSKHQENRKSIHDIRDGQQAIADAIHKLDLKFAKFTGYAIGAGAVIALLMRLVEVAIK